jgi:hypothetical protein
MVSAAMPKTMPKPQAVVSPDVLPIPVKQLVSLHVPILHYPNWAIPDADKHTGPHVIINYKPNVSIANVFAFSLGHLLTNKMESFITMSWGHSCLCHLMAVFVFCSIIMKQTAFLPHLLVDWTIRVFFVAYKNHF